MVTVKRCVSVTLFVALLAAGYGISHANDNILISAAPREGRIPLMSKESGVSELFDRWERVWHEGQYDLIPSCVGSSYIRHDESGDRTVTREDYAAEIAKTRQERPNLHFVVYDHSFAGDRAWFRFTLKFTDPKTGEARTRAGLQVYRIESGKLAETWLIFQQPGSAWPDAVAQEHWTSPAPIK